MKEKMAGKETKKRLFSGTLALTMILSMMQITSIPVMAATYTNGGLYEGGSGDSGEPAATKTVTITMDDVRAATGNSITKDGVTLTVSNIDTAGCNIMMGGTFTTSSEKITQIEIQGIVCTGMGDGWMAYAGANDRTEWTGSASLIISLSTQECH